jgi:hypothetical protein
MNILAFSKRAMAVDARKVLASAIANAENNHNLDVDSAGRRRGQRRQGDHHEAFPRARSRQVDPHPQAVQPAAHRRARTEEEEA